MLYELLKYVGVVWGHGWPLSTGSEATRHPLVIDHKPGADDTLTNILLQISFYSYINLHIICFEFLLLKGNMISKSLSNLLIIFFIPKSALFDIL